MTGLRAYQASMVQKALGHGNQIVVLPTGAGKTLVSLHVMFEALQRHPSRGVVFLAPTVPLVLQQAAAFEAEARRRGVNVQVGVMAGGKSRRSAESRVLFATPASALSLLLACVARLSLLVVDEVHHAVRRRGRSRHPYAEVARLYALQPGTRRPKLLGLTASPGADAAQLDALTGTLGAELLCCDGEHAEELRQAVPIPNLCAHVTRHDERFQAFLQSVDAAKASLVPLAQDADQPDVRRRLANVVELGARVRCIGWPEARGGKVAFEGLNRVSVDPLLAEAWQQLTSIDPPWSPCFKKMLALLHSRRILFESEGAQESFRAILFVGTRKVARDMRAILEKISHDDPKWRWLTPTILLGHNAADADGRFTLAKQTETLEEFRCGMTNVLVATSVAEEGIDIQGCSHVIRLEPPSSVIKLIQSRGRARFPGSYYDIVCIDEGEKQQLEEMVESERAISQILGDYVQPRAAENNWFTEVGASKSSDPPRASHGNQVVVDLTDDSDEACFEVFSAKPPREHEGRSVKRKHGPSFIDGRDYKSELNCYLQMRARRSVVASYQLVEESGPGHRPMFTSEVTTLDNEVHCRGEPMARRRVSEQSAAFHALSLLGAL